MKPNVCNTLYIAGTEYNIVIIKRKLRYSGLKGGCEWQIHIDVPGPIVCKETSTINYHYTLPNNSEERGSRLLSGGSLK
jgi:hypothetical protein